MTPNAGVDLARGIGRDGEEDVLFVSSCLETVWLSGPTCFSGTRTASPAPLLVGYTLIFYREDAGMVKDSLSVEIQLNIAAQTCGGLGSFFSPL